MHTKSLAATAALLLALTMSRGGSPLLAQEDGPAAELAPEIQISSWINGDGRDKLADYRGEVVLLEFWQTH